MEKDFDSWNEKKKSIDAAEKHVEFHEREIWWCSIGVNIGHEQHAEAEDFSRPVLIVRKFPNDMFWGIPLTTKIRNAGFRFLFTLGNIKTEALLLHMRALDSRRLLDRIEMLPKDTFSELIREIKSIL